jgi:hypothetical protein
MTVSYMLEREISKRGHPGNRFLIQDTNGHQRLIDATGLTWEMFGACRTEMEEGVIWNLEKVGRRPHEILIAYAREVNDPAHMYEVWHGIPPDVRSLAITREDTRFYSFYHGLRHWRRASVRHLLHHPVPRVRSRQTGAGLLFLPGQPGYLVSETAAVSGSLPAWQVIPAPDVEDFERRWHDTLDALTLRALRAGGLSADEIAAEWPSQAVAFGARLSETLV